MININDKSITQIKLNNLDILRVYLRRKIIWERDVLNSCFAAGYWVDELPWTDNLPWKDNI